MSFIRGELDLAADAADVADAMGVDSEVAEGVEATAGVEGDVLVVGGAAAVDVIADGNASGGVTPTACSDAGIGIVVTEEDKIRAGRHEQSRKKQNATDADKSKWEAEDAASAASSTAVASGSAAVSNGSSATPVDADGVLTEAAAAGIPDALVAEHVAAVAQGVGTSGTSANTCNTGVDFAAAAAMAAAAGIPGELVEEDLAAHGGGVTGNSASSAAVPIAPAAGMSSFIWQAAVVAQQEHQIARRRSHVT